MRTLTASDCLCKPGYGRIGGLWGGVEGWEEVRWGLWVVEGGWWQLQQGHSSCLMLQAERWGLKALEVTTAGLNKQLDGRVRVCTVCCMNATARCVPIGEQLSFALLLLLLLLVPWVLAFTRSLACCCSCVTP